jgi:hypothetical protein
MVHSWTTTVDPDREFFTTAIASQTTLPQSLVAAKREFITSSPGFRLWW